jgi:hypothetical protein
MVRRELAEDHNVNVVSCSALAHNTAPTRRERTKLAERIARMDEPLLSASALAFRNRKFGFHFPTGR